MFRILSRLLKEKLPSQIFRKLILPVDVFSRSPVFFRSKGFFSLFQGKYTQSVKLGRNQSKTHTYRSDKNSTTFFLEASKEDPLTFYMTAFGSEVKTGDFIVIDYYNSSMTYRVESIDYYLDPPDLWIAVLIEYGNFPKGI